MSLIQAILYGIVQGLTEFLPVSSTAHLIILSNLFGTPNADVSFDVALHLGTAIAVIVFFFKDWVRLIKGGLTAPKSKDGKLFWWIMAATVASGIIALVSELLMEDEGRALLPISISLIVFGVILFVIDKFSKSDVDIENIGITKSFIIGVSQAIALLPGVSRSGITITTGRLLGIKREAVAKFTFLLSTPTIVGAGLYKLKDIAEIDISGLNFAIAVITSAIVGALCIKFLLEFVKTKGFGIFAIYRLVLGFGILIYLFIK